jgi:hypothetical protein
LRFPVLSTVTFQSPPSPAFCTHPLPWKKARPALTEPDFDLLGFDDIVVAFVVELNEQPVLFNGLVVRTRICRVADRKDRLLKVRAWFALHHETSPLVELLGAIDADARVASPVGTMLADEAG